MTKADPPLAAPRLSRRTFPPYRFVPGRNPHPTSDPRGHSYEPRSGAGSEEPAGGSWVPPERWFESDDYLYGTDLHNHGYWWEAHEAWEALWQLTDKSAVQGLFLQGLIQVAACHLKLYMGRREGVERLLQSSTGYLRRAMGLLDPTPPAYMGLEVAAFTARVVAYYDARLRVEPLAHDADRYPYIVLAMPDGAGSASG